MRRWISVLDWLPHYRRADIPGFFATDADAVAHLDARASSSETR